MPLYPTIIANRSRQRSGLCRSPSVSSVIPDRQKIFRFLVRLVNKHATAKKASRCQGGGINNLTNLAARLRDDAETGASSQQWLTRSLHQHRCKKSNTRDWGTESRESREALRSEEANYFSTLQSRCHSGEPIRSERSGSSQKWGEDGWLAKNLLLPKITSVLCRLLLIWVLLS